MGRSAGSSGPSSQNVIARALHANFPFTINEVVAYRKSHLSSLSTLRISRSQFYRVHAIISSTDSARTHQQNGSNPPPPHIPIPLRIRRRRCRRAGHGRTRYIPLIYSSSQPKINIFQTKPTSSPPYQPTTPPRPIPTPSSSPPSPSCPRYSTSRSSPASPPSSRHYSR